MPISHQKNIFSTLNLVDDIYKRVGISSVLDIGAGFGKYGYLIRERLDIRFLRYDKLTWKTQIDCVEPYVPYISPVHRYIYNVRYTTKIEEIIDVLPSYDIVLMIDCLEHLEKSVGKELLPKLDAITNKLLILSFPNIYKANANSQWPNPLELHKCLWTQNDIESILGPVKKHAYTIYAKDKTR